MTKAKLLTNLYLNKSTIFMVLIFFYFFALVTLHILSVWYVYGAIKLSLSSYQEN